MNQIRLSRILVVFVLVKKMGKEENERSDVYKFVHVWGSEECMCGFIIIFLRI